MGEKKSKDWDFKIDDSGLKKEKESQKKEIKQKSSTLKNARQKSKKKLKLDDGPKTQFRAGRSASYKEHKDKNKNKVIVTPANPIKRLVAYFVDYGLVALISYFIPILFPNLVLELKAIYPIDSADSNYVLTELTKVASAVLGLGGFFLLVVIPMGSFGQTLGLKLLKIRIEHINGGTIGMFPSLLRNTLGLTLNTVLVFGMIMPLFQRQKRCLHDLIFKTICIVDDYE